MNSHEEITLPLFCSTPVFTGANVRSDQNSEPGNAYQYTENLSPMVASLEQEEGDNHRDWGGPSSEQKAGQEIGVTEAKDGQEIAKDVYRSKDEILPAVLAKHLTVRGEAVLVQSDWNVYEREGNVDEEGLSSWKTPVVHAELGCNYGCAGNAERQKLSGLWENDIQAHATWNEVGKALTTKHSSKRGVSMARSL